MIKTIAVTGASGFVGRHTVEALLRQGYAVKCLSRSAAGSSGNGQTWHRVDWDDPDTLKSALAGADAVIHSAAMHPNRTSRDRDRIINSNVDSTRVLLNALPSVDCFVMVSSMRALINRTSGGHFDGNSIYDFEKDDLPYGISKHRSEEVCREFALRTGLRTVIVNPTPVIGPGDIGPSPNGTFILGFIKSRLPLSLDTNYGFVDVRDVASAIELLMQKGVSGQRYVLCSANWPLKKFIRQVQSVAGIERPIFNIPMPAAYIAGILCDFIEKFGAANLPVTRSTVKFAALRPVFDGSAIEKLGFSYIPPENSVKDAVLWLLENYGNGMGRKKHAAM